MLLYFITDRRRFPGSQAEQRAALLGKISEAAHAGVDYIQLREKDLGARELLHLASEVVASLKSAHRDAGARKLRTRLLINSRVDVALACGAAGVHLRSDDVSAADARVISTKSGARDFFIAASCHTADDVRRAESDGADMVVFAPVFEKGGERGVGLEALRAACLRAAQNNTPEPSPLGNLPVLALGGITLENARACMEAGAAGIAAIRLFQDNDVAEVVARLREISKHR